MTNGTWLKVFAFVSLIVLIGGCAQTQQMKKPVKTGFLGPVYSQLREGEKGEALRVYKNPKANWTAYDKVIIDPVTIWRMPDSQLEEVSEEDLQLFANDLWSKLRETLKADYEIVHQPGPGVMRLSVAITEAEASNPTMDTVSSVIPQLRLLTGAKGMVAGGKPGFVGVASAEAKITDAHTGELLTAAVDRRAGTKSLSGSTDKWSDVQDSYQYWAEKLRWRLCQLRGGTNCIEPKA